MSNKYIMIPYRLLNNEHKNRRLAVGG